MKTICNPLNLKEEHLLRYKNAKKKPISFMLFDIDHNIVDEKSQLPSCIIQAIIKLINEKGIGIGFVSGRPEKAFNSSGQDIISILDKILPFIDNTHYEKIMIFPEYAGYGFNVGTRKLYDYGFIETFQKHKQILAEHVSEEMFPWLDMVEYKSTGISLWVKQPICDENIIIKGLEDIKLLLKKINLDKFYIAIDGAHRTIDILNKMVNKSRAIEEVEKIYKNLKGKIATSDDQADYNEGGYLFTNHPLGFATNSFYCESTMQISTKLVINEIGVRANMKLLEELFFQPLEIE